ncbi:hypothetical protein Q760_16125 [Cellulomonas cellasea DSM 20118]|uniref:Tyr recombinase domain-containing protein n=3 Tax=Cellulomonas cellasea TaxID=43670 RepID=A0A0A0B779_9CELL|nr:tyrosine-type recombinase/integrase [Cellulomonas cellasea]KGM02007.1 hypothetical protein Q760_16125 [Cellulomonas cellasea DSM 20118]GEA90111.1 hypothetical protein CCE01nite_40600 [Cellulomonas cellasea]
MPTAEELAAARLMLSRMGVTVDDLMAGDVASVSNVPTVAEFLIKVEALTNSTSRRTMESYWKKLGTRLGSRRLDEVKPSDIREFMNWCQENAVSRANGTNGTGAARNALSTARYVWKLAIEDGLVRTSPAADVAQVKRTPRLRPALDASELADLASVASESGDDPELDALLLRFHWETGARREGAIGLTIGALDSRRSTVRLLEKGRKTREAPITSELMRALGAHVRERGGDNQPAAAEVFRYRRGGALTRRRYNTLAERWQESLEWAASLGVSIHWVRHTALTETERCAGEAVAALLAGHTGTTTTSGYTVATLPEVAEALHQRTGTPHPLCTPVCRDAQARS